MPLSPAFTASESLTSPNLVTFSDTSTGSDGTITQRRIIVLLANGNYLTTAGESSTIAYETWLYSQSSITLNLLSKSTSANVTIQWLAGTTVVYTLTTATEWDLYEYLFGLELIQAQTANPEIIQDKNYYSNFFQFITNIWNSESAITYASDIYSSQEALNVNTNMQNNSDFYF